MSDILWCFIEGDTIATSFIPPFNFDALRNEIKAKKDTLQGVDRSRLVLWRPQQIIPVMPEDSLAERVGNWLRGGDLAYIAEKLHGPFRPVDTFDSNRNRTPAYPQLDVFVQVAAPGSPSPPVVEMLPSVPTRTEFTIRLRDYATWDRLRYEDLIYNNERLQRRRYIGNSVAGEYAALQDVMQRRMSHLTTWDWDPYFETDAAEPILQHDSVTLNEICHYISLVGGSALRNKANYDEKKEWQLRALLLEFLEALRLVPNHSWGFDTSLRFHLVIEKGNEQTSYTPRSDFHVSIKDFPHFLLEVNSQQNESDHYRMLLQAACVARIGNSLRASATRKPIVIMAIYIDKDYKAHQHLLCQPDIGSPMVVYVTNVFNLTAPETAFQLIFQLYNFLKGAKADNDDLRNPERQLEQAKDSVARKGYEKTGNLPHRSRPHAPGGAQATSGGQLVHMELTRAGYTLTQPISEALTLLTPLKPTVRQATSQSGVLVVLKIIVDSNERQSLQYLNGIKAPSNHTIQLLDVVDLSIGKTVIVLPRKSPLDEVLQFCDRPDDVVSLCLQFIEGVAFLHQHKVAHCDLKPGNVVVDTIFESKTLPRLFIIDFDLAEFVESEETMTEGWCGTPPWIAPELGSENGPIQRYSPILADRWACGRMIEYIAKYFPTYEGERKTMLQAFAQRLLDVNPRARPALNELQSIDGPKRKSTRSQQEPVPKRHASCGELNGSGSFGSSFEFPEAQAQQAIPALEKVGQCVVSDDGRDEWGDPMSLS
ncbi:hypothetical protein BGY98DRAFT_955055 [Russula aff. rugulosa BPL654]|nr:hypothetical protein BGY98DRAFT_955055 [Russula aff. rugulosa BPL654]